MNINFSQSNDWNCSDDYEYLECPVCHESSKNNWVKVETNTPKYKELKEYLQCCNCGLYFDIAQKDWFW